MTATLLGLGLAVSLGACEEEDNITAEQLNSSCRNWCEKRAECDDDVNLDQCTLNCEDTVEDCMADERDEVLADLDVCAEETCDDFTGCSIGAGFECVIGI
jgi:hypothetical protein